MHSVRVDGETAESDGVFLPPPIVEIALGDDIIGDRATSLADVEAVRPVTVVGELVSGQAPLTEVCPEGSK